MTWFQKEMDYARENLEQVSRTAIDHAANKLNVVVKDGVREASGELREAVMNASREVDHKLDKISAELHNQRQFTKDDVVELVDYAAEKLGSTLDERVRVMREEITALVQDRVEYLKHEVDNFFIQRQQDLARERRRLIANVLIAVAASLAMGFVSLMFHRVGQGSLDMLAIFRVVFASLGGGYLVFMLVNMIIKYRRMSEHRKDFVFLTMKYWGILRPESLFSHVVLAVVLAALGILLFFPDSMLGHWLGSEGLLRWVRQLKG